VPVTDAELLLRVEEATVRYGPTVALDRVDIDLRAGEVHAMIGENGAGKSTLLRLMTRVLAPDAGGVRLAAGARLAWAPQEAVLPADLTATEWIFLARERRGPLRLLRREEMRREAEAALREIGCRAAAHAALGSLSAAERKQVQLARALHGAPTVILLDEPTAALGKEESDRLFELLRARRDAGAGVLYVTHRLDEVRALADRVTVLRDGRRISTDAAGAVDSATLVRRMVGRDLAPHRLSARAAGETVLRSEALSSAHVEDATIEVHRGEIVGLAGLVGAGRSELLEAIAGVRPHRAGSVWCAAAPAFVPEDRNRHGLIPTFCLRENLFLPAEAWRLDLGRERQQAAQWIENLGIRARGAETPIGSLSGGNQQKLLLARALRREPALLLLDEPTAGVDVGAKAEIHDLIRRLAESGTAILLASSDLPELLALCDRIIALRGGRIAGEVTAAEASDSALGGLIMNDHDAEEMR